MTAALPDADPGRPAIDPLLTGLTYDAGGWVLEVDAAAANLGDALYGGAALGASVDIAGIETGWPVRWASTRFLQGPRVGDRLAMTFEVSAAGRRTCHATVRGIGASGVAFETMVVAGSGDQRDTAVAGQWVFMPPVPPPEECPPIPVPPDFAELAFARVERRQAYGFDEEVGGGLDPGHRAAWARFAAGDTGSPVALAWIADCVAMGVGRALGGLGRATSLDNTIRYVTPAPSEWVLVDVRATGSADGYAYGVVHLFAEDGRLLATGSQTCLARLQESEDHWAELRRHR